MKQKIGQKSVKEQSNRHDLSIISFLLRVVIISFNHNFDIGLRVLFSTVEAGSSLGLWVGLSALGIYDLACKAGFNTLFKKFKQ